MKLSAPKQITWWIAVVLGAVAILDQYGILSVNLASNFVLLMIGFLLLAIGTAFKGI